MNDFDVQAAERAYRQYEGNKLIVTADPTLTEQQKVALITRLTSDLEEAEAALGLVWHPVADVNVTATSSGTTKLPREETEEQGEGGGRK